MLAVISHDAGGAEVLSSYVRQEKLECIYVLEGPARRVFERKLGIIDSVCLDEAILRSSSILCGTSWQSDLEVNAIKLARRLGKPSVAFLDHWVNYRERFIRSGESFLPDEIWVGDVMAKTMAEAMFPNASIRHMENPYLHDIQHELACIHRKRQSMPTGNAVLYVCEPVSEHALIRHGNPRYWGYVEEEALSYFLVNIATLVFPVERIVIRPHPSEPLDKYDWIKREFDLRIEIGGTRTLLEEVVDSDVVVGCESMAMVVGLLAGKRVISSIPPEGKPCGLPHREIEKASALLKTNAISPKEQSERHEDHE